MRPRSITLAVLVVTLFASFAAGQSRPTDPEEAINRGNLRYSEGEYLAAIVEYGQIPPQAGKVYSKALFNIGVCYYELWRTEDAVAMYQKAVAARSGRYSAALYALGVALEDLRRLDEAKEAYLQALSAAKGREIGPAHFRLGLLLAGERDYHRAAIHFTEALNLDASPAGHNNLGVMLALKGNIHEAEREFETALKQAKGEFPDATNNLKLCRSLRETSAKNLLASLKVVETTLVAGKLDPK